LYAAFALAAARLARSAVSCGCFGEDELPASLWQAVVSAVFAVLALGALAALAVHVSAHGHGLGWVLGRPVLEAGALIVGIGGAAYATVLAYTLLPYAWTSWNGSAP
jgi:hypothetical protein